MSHGKLSWEQWSSHYQDLSSTKNMTSLSPISMQVSVERCSTIDRSPSLQKPKTFKSLRPLARSKSERVISFRMQTYIYNVQVTAPRHNRPMHQFQVGIRRTSLPLQRGKVSILRQPDFQRTLIS